MFKRVKMVVPAMAVGLVVFAGCGGSKSPNAATTSLSGRPSDTVHSGQPPATEHSGQPPATVHPSQPSSTMQPSSAQPSRADLAVFGRKYVGITVPVAATADAMLRRLSAMGAGGSVGDVAALDQQAADTCRQSAIALSRYAWPAGVHPAVDRLVTAYAAVVSDLRSAPTSGASSFGAWRGRVEADVRAAQVADAKVRATLALPSGP